MARVAVASAVRVQTWWAELPPYEQSLTLAAIAAFRTPCRVGSAPALDALATPVQRARQLLRTAAHGGMEALRIPPSYQPALRACVPAVAEVLRLACAATEPAQAAMHLAQALMVPRDALAAVVGEGQTAAGGPLTMSATSATSAVAGDADRAAVVDVPSWAWLLLHCAPEELPSQLPSSSLTSPLPIEAAIALLPCLATVAALGDAAIAPASLHADARRATELTIAALPLLRDAAAPLAIAAAHNSDESQDLLSALLASRHIDSDNADTAGTAGTADKADKADTADVEADADPNDSGGTVSTSPACMWESAWARSLRRARRDLCVLGEEGRAFELAVDRLRAACVRLHVQQLTCWVQAETLTSLANGASAARGESAAGLAALEADRYLEPGFDERTHAGCPPHHEPIACVLNTLRTSPELVASALHRAGLLRPRCPVAEQVRAAPSVVAPPHAAGALHTPHVALRRPAAQEAASQLLLCSLYGNRSHPADESAFLGLFSALCRRAADEGREVAGGAADPAGSGRAAVLSGGGFLHRLTAAYLRMLPGGAAWLQEALGAQLLAIADESERGLSLLTDPMDAYLSLDPAAKDEVCFCCTRTTCMHRRADAPHSCAWAHAHIPVPGRVPASAGRAILAAASPTLPAAPPALPRAPCLARLAPPAPRRPHRAARLAQVDRDVEHGEAAALGEHELIVTVLSARADALCARCEALLAAVLAAAPAAPRGLRALAHAVRDSVGVGRPLVALLFNAYVLPVLMAPEAYALPVASCTAVAGTAARQNLSALALSLEHLLSLVGADNADGVAGSALESAKRYFTSQLLKSGLVAAQAGALALCEAPLAPAAAIEWPPPLGSEDADLDSDDGDSDAAPGDADDAMASAAAGAEVVEQGAHGVERGSGEGGVVVLADRCLYALLRFVFLHLHVEIPLPPALLAMCTYEGEADECGASASHGATAAADDGGVLPIQSLCWYVRGEERKLGRVLNVHHDDDPPYYTVGIDGAERSTIRSRLIRLSHVEEMLHDSGTAADGRRALSVDLVKDGPLGITLENSASTDATPSPPVLTVIVPGGTVDRSGQLRVGDLIASINGVRLFEHSQAARVIAGSDGALSFVVLRKLEPAHSLRAGHGFGAIGPIKAFFEPGAGQHQAAADFGGGPPPLQLLAFLLPRPHGRGEAAQLAASSAPGTPSAATAAAALGHYLLARAAEGRSWPEGLSLALGAQLRVQRVASLAVGAWHEATRAEALADATRASADAPRALVAAMRSLRARRVSELRGQRLRRGGVMLLLGEVERASSQLEGRVKASLRRVHALVAHALVSESGAVSTADATPFATATADDPSGASAGFEALVPTPRPDGSAPLCFCHPPAMRTCRECTALKQRIEAATEALFRRLEGDDGGGGERPLLRQASIRSLRAGAASATQAVSASGHENAAALHERLQRTAVHTLLLERAVAVAQQRATAAAAAGLPSQPAAAPDALMLVCAGGQDEKMAKHCAALRGMAPESVGLAPPTLPMLAPCPIKLPRPPPAPPPSLPLPLLLAPSPMTSHRSTPPSTPHYGLIRARLQVGLAADVSRRCSAHIFDGAAELLAQLPSAVGPQSKLRLMLRAWDCVLGALGLCTDSPSADDFLPGMAYALTKRTKLARAHFCLLRGP